MLADKPKDIHHTGRQRTHLEIVFKMCARITYVVIIVGLACNGWDMAERQQEND